MRDKEGTVQPKGIGRMHKGLGYELPRGEQRLLEADGTDVGDRFQNYFFCWCHQEHTRTQAVTDDDEIKWTSADGHQENEIHPRKEKGKPKESKER